VSKLMLYASVALMLGATVAEAQEQPRQRPGGGDRPGQGGNPGQPGGDRPSPGGGPGRPGGGPGVSRPGPGGPQIQPSRPGRPDGPGNGGPGNGGPGNGGPGHGGPSYGGPQIQPPRPGNGGRLPQGGGWNRPPVSAPQYRYPRGYNYRRWNIGLLLPSIFLNSSYYYNDYGRLGFNAPPRGYGWVRYGPDLLLVNQRTGRIRDVRYGVFG
jgi:Ni/Co efflux regulator RcnB